MNDPPKLRQYKMAAAPPALGAAAAPLPTFVQEFVLSGFEDTEGVCVGPGGLVLVTEERRKNVVLLPALPDVARRVSAYNLMERFGTDPDLNEDGIIDDVERDALRKLLHCRQRIAETLCVSGALLALAREGEDEPHGSESAVTDCRDGVTEDTAAAAAGPPEVFGEEEKEADEVAPRVDV